MSRLFKFSKVKIVSYTAEYPIHNAIMKNKIFILIIILQSIQLIFCQISNGQIVSKDYLVGVWQLSTPRTGAGLLENFKFFKDGSFVYTFDPLSENKRFITLKGTFRITKNELYFKIRSSTEVVGGDVFSGGVGADEDLFVIGGYTLREKKVDKPKELDPLFIMENNLKTKSIKINNKSFYKLTSDPNKSF